MFRIIISKVQISYWYQLLDSLLLLCVGGFKGSSGSVFVIYLGVMQFEIKGVH